MFKNSLPKIWNVVQPQYKLMQIIKKGTYGTVVKAQCVQTSELVAIKYIQGAFKSLRQSKAVLREISILRQLSQMHNNIFTVKVLDVIVPGSMGDNYILSDGLFIVMEFVEYDFQQIISSCKSFKFKDNQMKIIIYNLLCAVNFLDQTNVMHRDLKPANILVTKSSNVKICDFGMARTMPESTADDNSCSSASKIE